MGGYKNKISCSRFMAGHLVHQKQCHRNVIVSRCNGTLKIVPFEEEIHSTPFFPEVEIIDYPFAIIARDGLQSIIIDM